MIASGTTVRLSALRNTVLAIAATLAVTTSLQQAHAEYPPDIYWAAMTGTWGEANNWSPAIVPGTTLYLDRGDRVHVSNGGTVLIDQAGGRCYMLLVGEDASTSGCVEVSGNLMVASASGENGYEYIGYAGSGTVHQTGGYHDISSDLIMGILPGSVASYTLTDGILRSNVNVHWVIGAGGTGYFAQNGGACLAIDGLTLARDIGSSGTYRLSGGTLTSGPAGITSGAGASKFIFDGGVLNCSSVSVNEFSVADTPGSQGASTLTSSITVTTLNEYVGRAGHGSLSHAGGWNNILGTLHVGYEPTGTGTYNLSGGAVLAAAESIGTFGSGTVEQSAGTNTVNGDLVLASQAGSSGTYRLTGGHLDVKGAVRTGGGVSTLALWSGTISCTSIQVTNFVVEPSTNWYDDYSGRDVVATNEWIRGDILMFGGRNLVSGDLDVDGIYVAHNELQVGGNIEGTGLLIVEGPLTVHGDIALTGLRLGPCSVFAQSGAQQVTNSEVVVDNAPGVGVAKYVNTGGVHTVVNSLVVGESGIGTYELGDSQSAGSLVGSGDMVVGIGGSFRGWGRVALTGILDNNGSVVADGFGTNRSLCMENLAAVTSSVEDWDVILTRGWYAVNHGKLTLPKLYVSPESTVINWGESPADREIDLVNSLQIRFGNVFSAGELSVELLASDRANVPAVPDGFSVIGVWDCESSSGLLFDLIDLCFRYDDALVASLGSSETDLRVLHFAGDEWVDVTSRIDAAKHLIYAEPSSSLSQFAVGVPEPATLSLLAVGGAVLLRRRRGAG